MSEAKPKSRDVAISELRRFRSERFMAVYANHAEATPSFYDLRLAFFHVAKDVKGEPEIEEQVAVDMTWEHAIRLNDMLNGVIKRYQDDNGKIRVTQPESQQPQPPIS